MPATGEGSPAFFESYRYTEVCGGSVGEPGATPTKAQGTTLRTTGLAQLRDGLWGSGTRLSPQATRPRGLIELRPMDRETARRNMRAGLVAGGIAAGIFALSFVAAFLYIAQ